MSNSAATDAGGVDELLQHARQDHRRTAAEAERPEQRLQIGLRSGLEGDRAAGGAQQPQAGALLGDEQVAALDLLDHAGHHVAHGRFGRGRHGGDAHAGALQTGGGRARAVDGIDDEDELRVGGALQAAVFRVVRPARLMRGHVVLQHALGLLVDVEGDIAAHGRAGVRPGGVQAEKRQHGVRAGAR